MTYCTGSRHDETVFSVGVLLPCGNTSLPYAGNAALYGQGHQRSFPTGVSHIYNPASEGSAVARCRRMQLGWANHCHFFYRSRQRQQQQSRVVVHMGRRAAKIAARKGKSDMAKTKIYSAYGKKIIMVRRQRRMPIGLRLG